MYIVTALDGLYMEDQAATCSLETARKLFTEWAKKWNIPIEPGKNECVVGEKGVYMSTTSLDSDTHTVYAVTISAPNDIDSHIDAYTCIDDAIKQYLRTVYWMYSNISDRDNEGNNFVDTIVLIMESYKHSHFNDSVWFDDTSVTFRTLKIV